MTPNPAPLTRDELEARCDAFAAELAATIPQKDLAWWKRTVRWHILREPIVRPPASRTTP